MAAYAALASLINLVEDIQNHPHLSTSFDHTQLQSLGENLDFLLNFVKSYNSAGQKKVEVLEFQIASEVHTAEDAIESYIVDLILSGSAGDDVEDVKSRMQNATEAMNSLKKSIVEIEAERGFRDKLPEYSSTRSHRSSKTTTVGFDDESIQLTARLIQGEPNRQVIPIVGMGGIGKTTLARLVYEHSHIAPRFDIRMWASISQQPRVENVLYELLYRGKNSTTETVNELGEKLHKKLWGRRYLIILDDMWSIETWHEIQLFLPDNVYGNRVIITTRLSNMATLLSSSPFEMKLLDEEKSWRLFRAKVFGEEDCPLDLEEIGKDIVRKCKGLALSIVVIGGHLGKSSRMKLYWESVGNDINSVLDSGEDQCLSILSLSYNHLPAHLKSCFLYIGVFDEDEEISGPRLIKLWIAEGLLHANEEKSKEEIAEECLKDLVDRNLLIVYTRDDAEKYYSCKIHDLLRELSIRVAKKENFLSVVDTTQTIDRERRVVIHKNIEPEIMFHAWPLVRSLKCEGGELSSKFRLLRVVIDKFIFNGDLMALDFPNVNLRYLDCHFVQPKNASVTTPYFGSTLHLPPSISLIWNLQTLQISGEYDKIVAPVEIWKMPRLRRLIVRRLCLPDPPHINDPILENLHTLEEVGYFSLSEEVCRRIPNIKQLSLSYNFQWESDEEIMYYYPRNLGCFHKLESLSCIFPRKPTWYHSARDLTFPSSLQELHLSNFPIHWDDLTMISSLPHLVHLTLCDPDHESEWNLVEKGFPCLRFLVIYGCYSLISWNAESYHFPVLEDVFLVDARELDEIPPGIGYIPTLKRITMQNCSESAAISAARILVEQQELGNDRLCVEVWINNEEQIASLSEILREEDLTCNNLYLY